MSRPCIELADIIRDNIDSFSSTRNLTRKQNRALSSIRYCRTAKLGYHLDQCSECHYQEISYNSCRDRHCPKCQGVAQRQWVEKRSENLLPVPYYHIVFTLPQGLFPLSLYNKRSIYGLLFNAAANTLKEFGKDSQWLGGEIGFFGILHTWGQTLWHHPHVHFLVAGGARSKNGKWLESKHKGKFLFPVHGLSKVFRGKFMRGLQSILEKEETVIPEEFIAKNPKWNKTKFLRSLVEKDWIVYCKSPMKKPEHMVKYIGRYTHKVAISNHRLLSNDNGQVSFSYRDYKDQKKRKTMSLSVGDFLQRFLWHVLPEGFHRIRHYGFLANGRAEEAIKDIIKIIGKVPITVVCKKQQQGYVCKKCGIGIMTVLQLITATGHLIVRDFKPLLRSP